MTSLYICSSSLTRAAPHRRAHQRAHIPARLRRAYAEDRSRAQLRIVARISEFISPLGSGEPTPRIAHARSSASSRASASSYPRSAPASLRRGSLTLGRSDTERLLALVEAGDEAIDLVRQRVEIEARAR